MSEIHVKNLYFARLPDELRSVITDYNGLLSLSTLATKVSLPDLLYLVYEQTTDPGFTAFLVENDLCSIMQEPANIAWLATVKPQYEAYVRKREEQRILNQVAEPSKFPIHVTHCNHTLYTNHENLVVLKSRVETDTEMNKRFFKVNLFTMLYNMVGYEALRKMKVTRYLLGLND